MPSLPLRDALPKIAIIGAGPAGLTLARILHINNIPCRVFEKEESRHARSQGGTLDLHPKAGQAAIKKAGLWQEYQQHVRYEGQDFVLADHKTGEHLVDVRNMDTGRPEIDRTKLREILLDSIPKGIIRWNSNLRTIDQSGSLHFAHGIEKDFDLVVGADGGWSKIRDILTPVKPFHSGIGGVDIRINDIDSKYPELSKRVGRGSCFIFGEETGSAMLCQRNGDGSVRIYCVGWKREDWQKTCNIDFNDLEAVKKMLLVDFATYHDDHKELIRCCDEAVPRTMYMLPVGLRWPHKAGFTCIGDAAHLMTPFAGQGVNIAMADAMMLAEHIIQTPRDIVQAIKSYESWMFRTAEEVTSRTWKNLLDRFEEGGSAKFVEYIENEKKKLEENQKKTTADTSLPKGLAMEQVKEVSKLD